MNRKWNQLREKINWNHKKGKISAIVVLALVVCALGVAGLNQKTVRPQTVSQINHAANRTWTNAKDVSDSACVAELKTQIDGVATSKFYDSLNDAFADSVNGDTIRLLQNCEVSSTIPVSEKSITLTADVTPAEDHIISCMVPRLENSYKGTLFHVSSRGNLTISGDIILTGKLDNGSIADVTSDTSTASGAEGSLIAVSGANATRKSKLVIKDSVMITGYYCSLSSASGTLLADSNGEIEIQNGTFTKNKVKGSGAFCHVAKSGNFVMQNGTVSENLAMLNGGALAVQNGGVATVSKGTFEKNKAQGGSAFYVAFGGKLDLSGAAENDILVQENETTATTNESGCLCASGVVTVKHTTFKTNTSAKGGAIFIPANGNLTLEDSVITENQAGKVSTGTGNVDHSVGGGIYDNGNLSLAGKVTITGNTNIADGSDNNVFINNNVKMSLASSELEETSEVGVSLANSIVGTILTGSFGSYTENQKTQLINVFQPDKGSCGVGIKDTEVFIGFKVVFQDNSQGIRWADNQNTHEIVVESRELTLSDLPEVTRPGYYLDRVKEDAKLGWGWVYQPQTGNPKDIKGTKITTSLCPDGELVLRANWKKLVARIIRNGQLNDKFQYDNLKDPITVAERADVIAVYDNFELNASLPVKKQITVQSADEDAIKTLTKAPSSNFFNITSDSNSQGNLTLKNIVLDGSGSDYSLITNTDGVLNIENGVELKGMSASSSSTGTGRHGAITMKGGITNINGGRIHNNYVQASGGGIYVEDGTLNIRGGEISENTATQGAGVDVEKGTFNFTGGSIISNHGTSDSCKGAGIYTKVDINFGNTATVNGNGTSGGNNIYLVGDAYINVIESIASSDNGVTLEKIDRNSFTKNFTALGGTLETFTSDDERYSVGVEDGEAFLGFTVTFIASNGFFKEDLELESSARPSSKDLIVRANNTVTPPVAYKPGEGLIQWQYDEAGVMEIPFTKDTIVTQKMTVQAKWGTANAYINKDGQELNYYSIATAIQDSQKDDTIVVRNSHAIYDTVEIDHSISIQGQTPDQSIYKAKDMVLFDVKVGTQDSHPVVSFSDIILDGSNDSYKYAGSLIKAEEGVEVQLNSGTKLCNVGASASETQVKTYGVGAVMVTGGLVTMNRATISDNAVHGRGAAVNVQSGQFTLINGTVENNSSYFEGGAFYVAKDGILNVQGGEVRNNVAGTLGINTKGNGGYLLGKIQIGTSEVNGSGIVPNATFQSDDLFYLTTGTKIEYLGKVDATFQMSVVVATPSQGAFTKNYAANAVAEDGQPIGTLNVTSDTEHPELYTQALDADGELFLGYAVKFISEEGTFDGEADDVHEKTIVYQEGKNPELPRIHNGSQALDGWYTSENVLLSNEEPVTKPLEVTARWVGAVCHIGDNYYATIESAVAASHNMTESVTIELLSSVAAVQTLDITTDVTIDGSNSEGVPYYITRSNALMMLRVQQTGKLTLKNITLRGNGYSYNVLFVNGGTLNIEDGATITGAKNVVRVENMLDTTGPGTIYVANRGKLNMTGGTITGNAAAKGAGIYIASGDMSMSGGSITGNNLSEEGSILGGGVYLGANTLDVSGDAVIADNTTMSGAQQNVYYITGNGDEKNGHLRMSGALSEQAKIGVTPSVGPTDIDSASMVDVTYPVNLDHLRVYEKNTIFSDVDSYETVVDTDVRKIRLRRGHTVTFDADPGALMNSNDRTKEIKDGESLATLPKAAYTDAAGFEFFFDGWYYEEAGQQVKLTTKTPIKKSLNCKAKYTLGQVSAPDAYLADGTKAPGGDYYSETIAINLKTETEDAHIFYTTDGSDPMGENRQEFDERNPIHIGEDTLVRAVAVRDGYTDSTEMAEQYRIRYVTRIIWTAKADTVFRGYESTFAAKVSVGNESTPNTVTWEIIGDHDEDTVIDEHGVIHVAKTEEADELTIRGSSANPSKYVETTVKVNNQYTVTYNKNSPDGYVATGALEDGNSPYLEGANVTVLDNTYSLGGYEFLSWNTKFDGTGKEYKPGDTFTITEDVELYAQWQVVAQVQKVSISPTTAIVQQGENKAFLASIVGTGNLEKGFTWSVSQQESEGTTISQNGILTVDVDETSGSLTVRVTSNDDERFYAEAKVTVKELQRYDVVYAKAGGSGSMADAGGRYISGTRITIAENTFTRNGYKFVSWNTAANGSGVELKPGAGYNVIQNTTFYAQWERTGEPVAEEATTEEPSVVPKEKTDKDYAEEVIALIEAIGDDVNLKSKNAIEEARRAYDKLTPTQKVLVGISEYDKLVKREEKYRALFTYANVTSEALELTTEQPVAPHITRTVTIETPTKLRKPLKRNQTFASGKLVYRVTKSALKDGTVAVLEPVSDTYKTVMVPAKVTYDDISYNVTSIDKNAFEKNVQLKKVTIGKNVTSIGKKAFYNDKKLAKVIVRSKKLKSVGKNAFKNLKYRAYIKMPDKKYRTYEKKLIKSKLDARTRLKTY